MILLLLRLLLSLIRRLALLVGCRGGHRVWPPTLLGGEMARLGPLVPGTIAAGQFPVAFDWQFVSINGSMFLSPTSMLGGLFASEPGSRGCACCGSFRRPRNQPALFRLFWCVVLSQYGPSFGAIIIKTYLFGSCRNRRHWQPSPAHTVAHRAEIGPWSRPAVLGVRCLFLCCLPPPPMTGRH